MGKMPGEISPIALAAGVAALIDCVSDAPRVLPDEEIVERIFRAVCKLQNSSQKRTDK
jgi:hypothetical protein